MKPVRMRLSRAKGFNLQDASLALNGLPAAAVTRPGRWGNPYRGPNFTAVEAVEAFRSGMEAIDTTPNLYWLKLRGDLSKLSGKNLACFCPLDQPCHADVLIEIANKPQCREVA